MSGRAREGRVVHEGNVVHVHEGAFGDGPVVVVAHLTASGAQFIADKLEQGAPGDGMTEDWQAAIAAAKEALWQAQMGRS